MQVTLWVRKVSSAETVKLVCDLSSRTAFGRDLSSPARLDGPGVSREHFALFARDGTFFVEDLSSNGTALNGKRLSPKIPHKLSPEDTIEIPGFDIELTIGSKRSEDITGVFALPANLQQIPAARKIWSVSTWFSRWELLILASVVCSLALVWIYANQ